MSAYFRKTSQLLAQLHAVDVSNTNVTKITGHENYFNAKGEMFEYLNGHISRFPETFSDPAIKEK